MTVNMLIQIDKLVQLLESPVFTCQCLLSLFVFLFGNLNFYQIFVFSFLSQNDTHTCISVSTGFSCFFHRAPPLRR